MDSSCSGISVYLISISPSSASLSLSLSLFLSCSISPAKAQYRLYRYTQIQIPHYPSFGLNHFHHQRHQTPNISFVYVRDDHHDDSWRWCAYSYYWKDVMYVLHHRRVRQHIIHLYLLYYPSINSLYLSDVHCEFCVHFIVLWLPTIYNYLLYYLLWLWTLFHSAWMTFEQTTEEKSRQLVLKMAPSFHMWDISELKLVRKNQITATENRQQIKWIIKSTHACEMNNNTVCEIV